MTPRQSSRPASLGPARAARVAWPRLRTRAGSCASPCRARAPAQRRCRRRQKLTPGAARTEPAAVWCAMAAGRWRWRSRNARGAAVPPTAGVRHTCLLQGCTLRPPLGGRLHLEPADWELKKLGPWLPAAELAGCLRVVKHVPPHFTSRPRSSPFPRSKECQARHWKQGGHKAKCRLAA